jgi:acyl carrier protein
MNSPSRTLVHTLLASHLQVHADLVDDDDGLEDLGLDALDLVLVVLRLEDLCGGAGDFPLAELANARTVEDVVALVDLWLLEDTMPFVLDDFGGRRGSAA